MKDVEIPPIFMYVFTVFLELYNNSTSENGFGFPDIESWQNVRKENLSQIDIEYIIKCKSWANSQTHKMDNEVDNG